MKHVSFAILASIGALLLPQAAPAQVDPSRQTGSYLQTDPKAVDSKNAGIIRKAFARCVYVNARKNSERLLLNSDVFSVDMNKARIGNVVEGLQLEDCLGDEARPGEYALQMRFSPQVLRDMLSEEAYLAKNSHVPILPTDAPPFLFRPTQANHDVEHAEAIARLGDCVIRQDIGGADALVRTMPGSDAEQLAAVKLAPAFGGCLLQGETFKLTAATIRALTAYALWWRFARQEAVQ